jgi:hypothetical protein
MYNITGQYPQYHSKQNKNGEPLTFHIGVLKIAENREKNRFISY